MIRRADAQKNNALPGGGEHSGAIDGLALAFENLRHAIRLLLDRLIHEVRMRFAVFGHQYP